MKNMNKLKNMARAFIRDESGQSTTEYVLLLVVVVFIIKQLKQTMGTKMQELLNVAFGKAVDEIQAQ